jgi:hypothetical protein
MTKKGEFYSSARGDTGNVGSAATKRDDRVTVK